MAREVVVKVKALASGGAFIGEIVSDPINPQEIVGKKIFLRDVAPEEKVLVEITKDSGSFFEGKLKQIIEPSSDRRTPPCKYYNLCGGCDLQHINIKAQRSAKLNMAATMLKMQGGGIEPKRPIELIGEELPEFGYRKRAVFHLSENGEIGFFKRETSKVVNVDECLLCAVPINAALKDVGDVSDLAKVFSSVSIQEFGGDILHGFKLEDGVSLDPSRIKKLLKRFKHASVLKDHEIILTLRSGEEVGSDLPTAAFAQVNEDGNKILVSEVLGRLKNSKEITEFYAGSGNFTIPLAKNGASIVAIELDKRLTDFGESEAIREGVASKITFKNSSTEKVLKRGKISGNVLLDPPRSGAKSLCEALSPKDSKKVIYVSCNLPSLVRDLKILVSKGYVLNSLIQIDMFAQTHHVEMVAEMIG